MYKFNKTQTFTQASTADFNFELFNVMSPYKLGDIVLDDRGKEFIVYGLKETKAYYDLDKHYINFDGDDAFKTTYGTMQQVKIQEYYPPNSFGAAMYRKYKTGFNIRVA